MAGPGGWVGGTLQHPRFPLGQKCEGRGCSSPVLRETGDSALVTDGERLGRARVAQWVCPQPGALPPALRRCLCPSSPSLPTPSFPCLSWLPTSRCTPVKPTTCFPSPHTFAGLPCPGPALSSLGWMAAVCFPRSQPLPFLSHNSRQYTVVLPVFFLPTASNRPSLAGVELL